jgi:endonuclease YncB( thermonuclease family)
MGNSCLIAQLSAKDSSVPDYSFAGQTMYGKIVDVYDGDTCTAVVKINGMYQKIKVRCSGYDSPEMKPKKDMPGREAYVKSAVASKDALSSMILNKVVRLEIHGFDKYGRFLATVFVRRWFGNLNMTSYMIENKYGYPYDGGKKEFNSLSVDGAQNSI